MRRSYNRMNNPTVTKHDLIELGYSHCTAKDLIKRAKQQMVEQGFVYYENTRLGRVPVQAVQDIIGVTLPLKQVEKGA